MSTAFLVRFAGSSDIMMYPDEFVYRWRALSTLNFHWEWSPLFMWDQPPLHLYLYTILISLFGSQLEVLRSISVISGALTVGLVYLFGKAMFNRKVGLIAALMLCFNGFHIVYSRIAQQEALMLLLLTGSVYLFWIGVIKHRRLKTALLGGLLLGLALDTKYIALFVYVSIFGFFILKGQDWGNLRLFKPEWRSRLFSREFFVFLTVSILVFIPVLLILLLNGANPFFWQLVGRFQKIYHIYAAQFGFEDVIVYGLQNYVSILTYVTWENSSLVFPPFESLYFSTTILLLMMTIYYIRSFLKGQTEHTFLLLLFAVPGLIFVIFPNRFQYYLLYTFPAYPLLFGEFVSRMGSRFRVRLSGSEIGRMRLRPIPVVALILSLFVLFGGVAAGLVSSQARSGVFDEMPLVMKYIKNRYSDGDYIGYIHPSGFFQYDLDEYGINGSLVFLGKLSTLVQPPSVRAYEFPMTTEWLFVYSVSLEPIYLFEPRFLILLHDEYEYMFTTPMKFELAKLYHRAIDTQGIILLERN